MKSPSRFKSRCLWHTQTAAQREQQEAAAAAAAAAERALEAERRTVAAARVEAAAAQEAAEAERAAKYAADAEARELQRILDAANAQLAQERCGCLESVDVHTCSWGAPAAQQLGQCMLAHRKCTRAREEPHLSADHATCAWQGIRSQGGRGRHGGAGAAEDRAPAQRRPDPALRRAAAGARFGHRRRSAKLHEDADCFAVPLHSLSSTLLSVLLRLSCDMQDLLNERERSFAAAEDAERLQAELAETQRRAADTERTLQAVRARSPSYSSAVWALYRLCLGNCGHGRSAHMVLLLRWVHSTVSICMCKLGIHRQRAKLKALHASHLAIGHSAVLLRRMKGVTSGCLEHSTAVPANDAVSHARWARRR